LLLDHDHPRMSLPDAAKIWCQTTHVECLAQLAAYERGRAALLAEPAVTEALSAVAGSGGLSDGCREMARSTLVALSDRQHATTELSLSNKQLHVDAEGGRKHVMLSCACARALSAAPS